MSDEKNLKVIQFDPVGTCCKKMFVAIDEEGKIQDAEFIGGCPGNLQAVKSLIKGCTVDYVIERLQGITCGGKSTSCGDQLAQCLIGYKHQTGSAKV